MNINTKSEQIANGVYWVGFHDNHLGLQCNPYLLVDQDEAVLFDPGSVLDFEYVLENIKKIISIEQITHVVLHHQDPDLCSSVPLFEKAGAEFTIVTSWRTQTLLKYYGITSEYYLLDAHQFTLCLKSGRELQFTPTPYLHFAGSVVTYDKKTKTLFSSDLFGAFSNYGELFAGKNYLERMKAFHEHTMPSNDILRPVMETLLLMDIQLIAPQHGSIIDEDISTYIKALRDLECGTFLNYVTKNLKKSGGYAAICEMILQRFESIYSYDEVLEAIDGLDLVLIEGTIEIKDYLGSGAALWENLFEQIYLNKGIKWLLIIEPLVQKITKSYELHLPQIFKSQIRTANQESILLKEEVLELKEINEQLMHSIEETQGRISRCPVTGLFNETFFKEYLKTELDNQITKQSYSDICLAVIGLDHMPRFRYTYGDTEANDLLKSVAYLLQDIEAEHQVLFRLQGDHFACFFQI